MKKLIYLLLLTCLTPLMNAQYTGLSVSGGLGTYKLNDLKLFQDQLIATAPADGKGIAYFPAFTSLKIEAYKKNLSGWKYGITYAFSTTGAHANYKDYSGNMNIDQSISSYQLGISAYYPLLKRNYFEVKPFGRILVGVTVDHITRDILTTYERQDNFVKMYNLAPAGEAGIETIYHFLKYSFALEAGYQYDVGGTMRYNEKYDEEAMLFLPDREVRSNMSGMRILLKFVLRINGDPVIE